MIRWLWLGCLISSLTPVANAEELVLHLEVVEHINQPNAIKAPEDTTIRQIEVLVEPNKPFHFKMQEPFHFKMQAGKETITFSGKIKPVEGKNKEKEQYTIDVLYRWELDTGAKVLVAENKWKPLPSIRGFNSTLGLTLGQPLKAAEISTKDDEIGKHYVSDYRYLLVLKKHSPIAQK